MVEELQSVPMKCKKCDHAWSGNLLVGVEIKRALSHMKAIVCPSCRAKAKYVVLDFSKQDPETEAAVCEAEASFIKENTDV